MVEFTAVLKKVFQLLRQSSPKLSILVALFTAMEAVVSIGALYVVKLLIDFLTAQFSGDVSQVDRGEILFYLAFTGGALLATVVLQTTGNLFRAQHGMVVGDYVDQKLHSRAIKVDLSFYESPKYFDSLRLARQGGAQRPALVVGGGLLMFRSAAFLIAVLVLIAGIDWRLLPMIILAMAAVLYVRVKFTKQLFSWYRDFIQLERRSSYLDDLMTSNLHAKEVRFGGLGAYLKERYSQLRKRIREEHLAIERRRTVAELVVAVIGVLVFAGATVFLMLELLRGELGVGDLVLFVLLFRRAEGSGKEFVSHVSKLYDDRLYLGQLFDFLDVEPMIKGPSEPVQLPPALHAGLRFENVSFQYPDTEKFALADVNMTLRPGQITALVGVNGSGKTSLIKLLTRLYDVTDGKITLDGTDIRSFDPVTYRALFSIIFQDFSKYSDSVSDNIRFQDIEQNIVSGAIEAAAERAGADQFIANLPEGYDTVLTRVFDGGAELSIGQWQRIALARAFYSNSQFMILDEPSSALDPDFEFTLFENFRERLGDRGALIISHRLSTIRLADYIYVLDQGTVVEHGNHGELIKLGGQYAALFEKQGRNYRA
tara:strand:+ start:54673 stop:56466 length:1794 start_codon:yes stop_codon:yes gene_type:complete